MNIKSQLRSLEKAVIITYLGLWLFVYVLSRISLEMYRDVNPRSFLIWIAVAMSPFCIYAALRTLFSKGEKWYGFIGYFLIFTIGTTFITEYIIVNGDMLLNAAFTDCRTIQVPVQDVHKVYKRKLGFDHTAITLNIDGKPTTMKARPYAYFYLYDKKTLQVTVGKSSLGNDYITAVGLKQGEKTHARWLHFKDWIQRFQVLWIMLFCIVIGVWINIKYFPDKPGSKPITLGFWKIMAIVMAILFAIAFLLYVGLWLYVTYFSSRHL